MIRLFLPLIASLATGCIPQDQTPACAAYVTCIQARDVRDGTATDLARFLPEGDCWAIDAGAELCDRACDEGLVFLRTHESNLPTECQP